MSKSPYATLDNPRKRLKWLQERLAHQEMMLRVAEGDVRAGQKCVEGIRVEIAECEKLVEERRKK